MMFCRWVYIGINPPVDQHRGHLSSLQISWAWICYIKVTLMDLKCWGKAHVEYWSDYITVLPCSTRWTPNLPICSIGHFNAHFPGVWCGICRDPFDQLCAESTVARPGVLWQDQWHAPCGDRCCLSGYPEGAWLLRRRCRASVDHVPQGKCVPCKSDVVKELGSHYWVLITMDMCKALIVCDKCFIREICFCGL